jgi:chromosome segregation ATPase
MTRKVEPKAKPMPKMLRDKRGRYITNAALASQLNATQGKLDLANKEIVRLETACEQLRVVANKGAAKSRAAGKMLETANKEIVRLKAACERLNAEIAEHDNACESLTVRIQCERAESSKAIRLLSEQKEELILEHNDLYNELRDENEQLRNAAAARDYKIARDEIVAKEGVWFMSKVQDPTNWDVAFSDPGIDINLGQNGRSEIIVFGG